MLALAVASLQHRFLGGGRDRCFWGEARSGVGRRDRFCFIPPNLLTSLRLGKGGIRIGVWGDAIGCWEARSVFLGRGRSSVGGRDQVLGMARSVWEGAMLGERWLRHIDNVIPNWAKIVLTDLLTSSPVKRFAL